MTGLFFFFFAGALADGLSAALVGICAASASAGSCGAEETVSGRISSAASPAIARNSSSDSSLTSGKGLTGIYTDYFTPNRWLYGENGGVPEPVENEKDPN